MMTQRSLLAKTNLGCVFLLAMAAPDPGPLLAQERPHRTVAFTFDDLPANTLGGPEAYADILLEIADTLEARSVPAIGFVNEDKLYEGDRLDSTRVALLAQWLDAGRLLGNHGFGHIDLHTVALDTYLAAIERGGLVTSRLLEDRGERLVYYRHPFLHTGRTTAIRDSVTGYLVRQGMLVAPVTIDNQEWIFARAYERALGCRAKNLADRIGHEYVAYMDSITGYYEAQSRSLLGREIPQVLLLHANRLNARYLHDLIALYRRRGYEFVPLEEALADPAFATPDHYDGPAGITWIHRWALTQGARGRAFAGEPTVSETVQEAFEDPSGLPGCRGTS